VSDVLEPVIGLEVHVQLDTRTKLFSSCPNTYGKPPNTVTDPVVVGLPGVLPVANREAFGLAVRVGLALGAEIAEDTRFDRKQYFYPDLPKGYQISQYERPIVSGGRLVLPSGRTVAVVRAHLEEDAGKGIHEEGGGGTLIDLNRCGIPLLEIVSGPDMRSPGEAVEYLAELKLLLRHLAVSDCDMEKGSLRCDVNVSLRPEGSSRLGVRTEIKNLNSFKAVQKALEHEIARHGRILGEGASLAPDTRLWDEDRGETRLMRTKEESSDYRYLPDPDLPPHRIERSWIEGIRAAMPELPRDRLRRYTEELGLSEYDARVLIQDPGVCGLFDGVVAGGADAKAAANWITGELFAVLKEEGHGVRESAVTSDALGRIIALVSEGRINVAAGRKVLRALHGRGGDPDRIVAELGLAQLEDRDAMVDLVRAAMEANPRAVEDVRAGKGKAAGAIVGFVMRESRGRANPKVVNEILRELL